MERLSICMAQSHHFPFALLALAFLWAARDQSLRWMLRKTRIWDYFSVPWMVIPRASTRRVWRHQDFGLSPSRNLEGLRSSGERGYARDGESVWSWEQIQHTFNQQTDVHTQLDLEIECENIIVRGFQRRIAMGGLVCQIWLKKKLLLLKMEVVTWQK